MEISNRIKKLAEEVEEMRKTEKDKLLISFNAMKEEAKKTREIADGISKIIELGFTTTDFFSLSGFYSGVYYIKIEANSYKFISPHYILDLKETSFNEFLKNSSFDVNEKLINDITLSLKIYNILKENEINSLLDEIEEV